MPCWCPADTRVAVGRRGWRPGVHVCRNLVRRPSLHRKRSRSEFRHRKVFGKCRKRTGNARFSRETPVNHRQRALWWLGGALGCPWWAGGVIDGNPLWGPPPTEKLPQCVGLWPTRGSNLPLRGAGPCWCPADTRVAVGRRGWRPGVHVCRNLVRRPSLHRKRSRSEFRHRKVFGKCRKRTGNARFSRETPVNHRQRALWSLWVPCVCPGPRGV